MPNWTFKLREARKALGLTQGELAKKIDFARVYISRLERGENGPGREYLEALISLGISPDWLFLDKGAVLRAETESSPENPSIIEKSSLPARERTQKGLPVPESRQTGLPVRERMQTGKYESLDGEAEFHEDVTDDNIHHTAWFQALPKNRRWLVAAVNTEGILNDEMLEKIKAFIDIERAGQKKAAEEKEAAERELREKGEIA